MFGHRSHEIWQPVIVLEASFLGCCCTAGLELWITIIVALSQRASQATVDMAGPRLSIRIQQPIIIVFFDQR